MLFAMSNRDFFSRSLHSQVVQELGLRIVRGDYPIGTAMPTEEALCKTLAVSRTALREALKMLSAKGLIESRTKLGTRVRVQSAWNMLDPDVLKWRCTSLPTEDFARNLMQMREIIEPAAAALTALHRTDQDLLIIESAFLAMQDSQTLEQWVVADLDFHRAILAGTQNELLIPLGHLIGAALETLFVYSARTSENYKASLVDHERVLDAIRLQDTQAAFHVMSFLLSNTRRNIAKQAPAGEPLNKSAKSIPLRFS